MITRLTNFLPNSTDGEMGPRTDGILSVDSFKRQNGRSVWTKPRSRASCEHMRSFSGIFGGVLGLV
jgi:hypothetical protein